MSTIRPLGSTLALRLVQSISLALALSWLPSASAQQGASWDIRANFAGTVEPLGSVDLGNGFGVEGTVSYMFTPRVGMYGGWNWHRFWNDRYYRFDEDVRTEEYGWVIGAQWQNELWGWPGTSYRIRAGVTGSRLRFENTDRSLTRADNAKGWEIGLGLITDLGYDWKVTQAVRYRAQRRAVVLGAGPDQAKLRYFSLSVGVSRAF